MRRVPTLSELEDVVLIYMEYDAARRIFFFFFSGRGRTRLNLASGRVAREKSRPKIFVSSSSKPAPSLLDTPRTVPVLTPTNPKKYPTYPWTAPVIQLVDSSVSGPTTTAPCL